MPDAEKDPQVIRVPAVLCGADGSLSHCKVETWKERSSSGKSYTRCRIVDDPPALPDSEYTIEFAGRTVRTNKYQGKWELTFVAPAPETSEAA